MVLKSANKLSQSAFSFLLTTFFVLSAVADSPAPPDDPAGAMWTLDDIYNVLDTRTTNVAKRTGAFSAPQSSPAEGSMRSLDDIMGLVTNRAPVPKTGQAVSYFEGDDGWWSTNGVGVAWPDPRFTFITNGTDEVVRDNLTGLIWVKAPHELPGNAGAHSQPDAIVFCENLTYAGYSDWRLPNRIELGSIVNISQSNPRNWLNAQGFVGIKSDRYWQSTPRAGSATYPWYVNMQSGAITYGGIASLYNAWPVRGGQ